MYRFRIRLVDLTTEATLISHQLARELVQELPWQVGDVIVLKNAGFAYDGLRWVKFDKQTLIPTTFSPLFVQAGSRFQEYGYGQCIEAVATGPATLAKKKGNYQWHWTNGTIDWMINLSFKHYAPDVYCRKEDLATYGQSDSLRQLIEQASKRQYHYTAKVRSALEWLKYND